MEDLVEQMRHAKERRYGGLMMICGGVLWGLLALMLLASILNGQGSILALVLYGALLWGAIEIGKILTHAYIYGHYVLIGPEQFPELHQMVTEGAANIGLPEAPKAFVFNSAGLINAFAHRLMGGRYVWLTSALVTPTPTPKSASLSATSSGITPPGISTGA